jgi:phosphatidylglycerol:prolipoprotein diacylglycerol transferase
MKPVLFIIGGTPVPSYGVFLLLAFVAGAVAGLVLGRKDGMALSHLLELAVLINVTSLLGARLLYALVNWPHFRDYPAAILRPTPGGMVLYGGVAAAVASSAAYVHLRRLDPWRVGDAAAPGIALGIAVARIGCYMAGCCYGSPCDLPWAVRFPPLSPAAVAFGAHHHVHPTQLYSSAGALLLFVVLVGIRLRRRFPGQAFLAFLILYGGLRLLLETVRGDAERGLLWGWLSTSSALSLVALAVGGTLYARRRKAVGFQHRATSFQQDAPSNGA